jgi:hypothetical protein
LKSFSRRKVPVRAPKVVVRKAVPQLQPRQRTPRFSDFLA